MKMTNVSQMEKLAYIINITPFHFPFSFLIRKVVYAHWRKIALKSKSGK